MKASKNSRNSLIVSLTSIAVIGALTGTASAASIGDVFYIDMENHNFTQPSSQSVPPNQIFGNPAAPYQNSLITPGNLNAAQVSYATNYTNVAPGIHPSEPNYIWQEGGSNYGVLNDNDPYANNGANIQGTPNLSGLLQKAGISWKSYQEDTNLVTVNGKPTNTPVSPGQTTVPLNSFSGTSSTYTNPYNGSNQYNFATKHDGQLFYTDTNGGNNTTTSNPEASYYAPLQQLQTDLTNNTVAQYNLITPDQYNDSHTALATDFTYNGVTYTAGSDEEAIAQGDNFLSIIVPEIEASQAYKNNGEIVIWWDETEGGDTSAQTLEEIVISPLAKGNAFSTSISYTHSSDLKTLQEVFDVSAPGGGFLGDANSLTTNDLSALYLPGTIPQDIQPLVVPEASSNLGLILLGVLGVGSAVLRSSKNK